MSNYKNTLNIPNTDFSMQANLKTLEPKIINKWLTMNLIKKLQDSNKPLYVMDYGPPYLNGNLHIGHGANMLLKDIILRSRNLLGYRIEVTPGFDCHGLPIELKAQKNFKFDSNKSAIDNIRELRRVCAEFNNQYLDGQINLINRTGMLLSTDKYYMTRNEVKTIYKTFSELLLKDLVHVNKKPVIWSINEKTTIADSEVEYKNKKSKSIFFMLKVQKKHNVSFDNVYLACWTTTPWTLIDNSAVAYNPNITYCFVSYYDKILIVAENCINRLKQLIDIQLLAKIQQDIFIDMYVSHPIRDMIVPVLAGSHVTDTDGTGFVHTAPAHGLEDFDLYLHNSIELFESTNDLGYYVKGSILENKHIFDNEEEILDAYSNITLAIEEIEHSYPYSQRTNTPIIYRATEQIFIEIHQPKYKALIYNSKIHDEMCINLITQAIHHNISRDKARDIIHLIIERISVNIHENIQWIDAVKLFSNFINFDFILLQNICVTQKLYEDLSNISSEIANDIFDQMSIDDVVLKIKNAKYSKLSQDLIDKVHELVTVPNYLKDHLLEALNNRKEWCVSRQRVWGVPLALFIHKTTGQLLINEQLQEIICQKIEKDPEYFLSFESVEILKEVNINSEEYRAYIGVLDVWFDSGCVFNMMNKVADVYCEGKDQVRGWFQSSLWISYLTQGKLPYKAIISHGFVLDDQRNKMSKSLGNVRDYKELINELGRDILGIWIGQSDSEADIKITDTILTVARETYRKFRNVLRYLISVSEKFEGQLKITDNLEHLYLAKYNEMEKSYLNFLQNYKFKDAFQTIYLFISDISSTYFNARKDSLYCDRESDVLEIRHFMYFLLHNLLILLTIFIPFTTDEIADYIHMPIESIHLYNINNLIKAQSKLSYDLSDEINKICIPIRQEIDTMIREKSVESTNLILNINFQYPDLLEKILKLGQCIFSNNTTLIISDQQECHRCFKSIAINELCQRCEMVINEKHY